MSQDFVISLAREAIATALLMGAPILIVSLAVGLIISIFQATTQIQEQTLTFVPKITAVFFALMLFGTWMLNLIVEFTLNLYTNMGSMFQ